MAGLSEVLVCITLAAAGDAAPVDFGREIRPILAKYCFQCHGFDDKARKGDLRLDEREGATKELPSGGRAVVPNNPFQSELLGRIADDDDSQMPPKEMGKRLTPAEQATLRRWIQQGAPYSKHWSYIAPVRRDPPKVKASSWPKNDVDRFILARLEKEGLQPALEADRYTLARRAALDLTGLPPTLEDAERFVRDVRPDAYERFVDQLLAKPSYGERWAAVWLDLARYADSHGYAHDPPRTIWRWRDWVIEALNANLPFDRFTIEQLAGDLLPNPTPSQLIATGFHRNTLQNTEGGSNAEEFHHASVVDRVNTTMQVWMGTSLACAQCHNHKYDPFTHREYYQLLAVFNNTVDFNGDEPILDAAQVGGNDAHALATTRLAELKKQLADEMKKVDAKQPEWEKTVDPKTLPKEVLEAFETPTGKRVNGQQDRLADHHRSLSASWKALSTQVTAATDQLAKVGTTTPILREGPARPTHIRLRGEFGSKGDLVTATVPAALHPFPKETKLDRLGLARWIVDANNPLTARVTVNRIWQEIFGVGIVETSEEFGLQGEAPCNVELLDWLATEYVRLGWDTKKLLKLILTSAAYRQSSKASESLVRLDPANRLLARGPRVRLSAEMLRDQSLVVAGLLSSKMYGPPVQPPQPKMGLAAAFGSHTDWEPSVGEDRFRRALYTRWRRNLPYPSMTTFDAPERSVCSARRIRTNTPLQALVLLNDPVFVEAAQGLARRILREGGTSTRERAAFGFRTTLIRPANETELTQLIGLYEKAHASLKASPDKATALATKPAGALPTGIDVVDAAAWTVVGNVLLNLDETVSKR